MVANDTARHGFCRRARRRQGAAGSLELSGSATTFIGQQPTAVTPTPLPALGDDVTQPGAFDVILPIRIGYDVLKDKIMQAATTVMPAAGMSLRDIDIYPSSGKLVVGLRIAKTSEIKTSEIKTSETKASETDAAAGQWVYLTAAIQVDADGHAVRLSDLAAVTGNEQLASVIDPIITQLRDKTNVDYEIAYQNLLKRGQREADPAFKRPIPDGRQPHVDEA